MWRWMLAAVAVGATLAWWDLFGGRSYGIAVLAVAGFIALYQSGRHIQRRRRVRAVEGLRALSPEEFEAEVARWLRRAGYHVAARGGTGDGGVDLIARKGRETLAVQCKRYAAHAAVSAAQVRDLYGAAVAEGSTCALLVTTGRISNAARLWAAALPGSVRMHLLAADDVSAVAAGGLKLPGG